MAKRRKYSSKGIAARAMRTLKGAALDTAILYPAGKTVWAVDSMARNVLPVGMPQEARTPLVGVGLAVIPQLFGDHPLTNRISELVLAQSLVQTLQQFGNKGTGASGTIDAQVNKLFTPIASVGMSGYVQRMRGYVEQQRLRGYVTENMGRGAREALRGLQAANW